MRCGVVCTVLTYLELLNPKDAPGELENARHCGKLVVYRSAPVTQMPLEQGLQGWIGGAGLDSLRWSSTSNTRSHSTFHLVDATTDVLDRHKLAILASSYPRDPGNSALVCLCLCAQCTRHTHAAMPLHDSSSASLVTLI